MQPAPPAPARLIRPEDDPASVDEGHWHVHADGTRHHHAHGDQPHHHPPHDHPHPEHSHSHPHPASVHDSEVGPGPGQRQGSEAEAGQGPQRVVVDIAQPVLARNRLLAERNRGYLRAKGIRAVNLMSSPGAGKTTLLEQTLPRLGEEWKAAVVVGDLATARDGERLRATGTPVVQITTGTVCHLDAEMVARGLEQLDLGDRRLLFVENVGNLVCPADFDLGEESRVVLLSVTEGEDKPLKYPPVFKSAHAVVITKLDLAAVAGTDLAALLANVRGVAPQARVFQVSARTGAGLELWLAWLRGRVSA